MKRFITVFGLGLGLMLGGGMLYALAVSEAFRLLAVGLGAFLLATITIGGTALLVNRQWTQALQQRGTPPQYPAAPPARPPAQIWEPPPAELLPPLELDQSALDEPDDIVA